MKAINSSINPDNIKLKIEQVTIEYEDDYGDRVDVTASYKDDLINTSVSVSGSREQPTVISALKKLYEKVEWLNVYNSIPSDNIVREKKYI